MISTSTISFLKELKLNNNKDWMTKNKKRYETAREDFDKLFDEIAFQIATFDNEVAKDLENNKHVFRINRDLRFSKDKTPYKSHFSGILSPYGKRRMSAGYYLHIEPGNSAIGGGLYEPGTEVLGKIRKFIVENYEVFEKLLRSKSFKSHFDTLDNTNMLIKLPREFEATKDELDLIKLKSYHVMKKLDDSDFKSSRFVNKLMVYFKEIKKLNDLLNKAIK